MFIDLASRLMNPGIRVVAKSDDAFHNIEKLEMAGADAVIARHEEGTRVMVRKGLPDRSTDGGQINSTAPQPESSHKHGWSR